MANDPKTGLDPIERVLSALNRMLDRKLVSDDTHQKAILSSNFKSAVGGYLAVAITLGVGAGGIIMDTYLKNRDRDDQALQQANQRKLKIIIDISNAMTSMRELYEITRLSCHKTLSNEEKEKIQKDRITTGYNLVKASRPVLHYFNERFRLLLVNFLKWEESISNYCDKNAPAETEWRKRQKEIEDEMVLSQPSIFMDI